MEFNRPLTGVTSTQGLLIIGPMLCWTLHINRFRAGLTLTIGTTNFACACAPAYPRVYFFLYLRRIFDSEWEAGRN